MNDLLHILERLDLQQYLENFVEEGFDSWETVLYITESDLDALNVKLGHRRRLQREIAHARGIPFEQLLAQSKASSGESGPYHKSRQREGSPSESRNTPPAPAAKRKYRRHPKPDENAPERPPSAYVIFSNKVREELKPRKLSFTEIAKAVGERWQSLPPEGKEPYESQAAQSKDEYIAKMVEYKKTTNYADYMNYLANFKAKYSTSSSSSIDSKRARLETESSTGSTNSLGSSGSHDRYRQDSTSVVGTSPSNSVVGSPVYGLPRPLASSAHDSSSPSSTATTPISATHHRLSVGSQNAPVPARTQQLPRIASLESRDHPGMQPSLQSLMTDSHTLRGVNTRRSAAAPPVSLLRHDTSKSSISSNNTSAGSSVYTPITPIDETRPRFPSQSQQPPPPPLSLKPLESRSADAGRPFTLPPLSNHPSQEYGSPTQAQPPFYYSSAQAPPPSTMGEGLQQVLPVMQQRPPLQQRPRSDPHDSQPGEEKSSHSNSQRSTSSGPEATMQTQQQQQQQGASNPQLSPRHDRVDALSVLAMAGNMVGLSDEERERPP